MSDTANHEQSPPDRMGRALASSEGPGDSTFQADPRLMQLDRLQAMRVESSPPALNTTAPTPLGLLKAFRRRSNLALLVGTVLALAAGSAVWVTMPESKYTTEAVLRLSAHKPQVLFRTIETTEGGADEYKRFQQTQIGLIRSRKVLDTALSLEGMEDIALVLTQEHEDPIDWLQQTLELNFAAGSELLHVALSGNDPKRIARLVNAIKQAYMDQVADNELAVKRDRFDLIQQLRTKKAGELKAQREQLRNIAKQLGSDHRETLALKQQFAMQQLSMVEQELVDVDSQKRRAEAELAMLILAREAGLGDPGPADSMASLSSKNVNALLEEHPAVIQARGMVEKAEAAYEQYYRSLSRLSRKPSVDPSLQSYQTQVLQARQRLERLRMDPALIVRQESPGQSRMAKTDRIAEVQARIGMLDDLKSRLLAVKETLGAGNLKITVETLDLQDLQDKVGQLQTTLDKMVSEEEALSVELQAPRRVESIEDAVVPKSKDDKKRYMMIVLASLVAFGAGVGSITFVEFLARKVDSIDDVVTGLGIRIVGTLPNLPPRVRRLSGGRAHPRDSYWSSLMLESIDSTRTTFLHITQESRYRVIMVTSALGGEGKTSLACHLATSLTRAGRATLLIDADLRRPSLDRLFDLSTTSGLSEVLRGQTSLENVIVPTMIHGLSVMGAGEYDEATLLRLAAGGLTPILDESLRHYDYVIVDSSPVLPVADALVIAQAVDGVVMSVLQEISRMPKVFAAYQKLLSLNVPVLGAIVTGASGDLYGNDGRYVSRSKEKGPMTKVES